VADVFDVVAVRLDDSSQRVIATRCTRENAEAVLRMAVARRGVDEEYFNIVPTPEPPPPNV
jgi:hypothetical protein